MFNFQIYLAIIFITISQATAATQTHYKYLTYSDIVNKFENFAQTYSNYVKVAELREEAKLENLRNTQCGSETCKHIYAELTNFNNPDYKKLPQVFLVGGFHGDEALGPNIVTYLVEYILLHKDEAQFKEILDNKMIVLLPMANPSGYYRNRREEYDETGFSIDMNRDFPYNNEPSKCFKTAGARVINYLFKKYLFQNGITFHGGMYAIGYPWGSENHLVNGNPRNGHLSPDNTALKFIGNFMQENSPGNKDFDIPDYPVNTLTNGIYAVPGTLEDWAYAASWEQAVTNDAKLLAKCEEISEEELKIPDHSAKSLFYLIETSEPKKPLEKQLGTVEATLDPKSRQFGHIPRNIMASLALIDTVAPSIRVSYTNLGNYKLQINWKLHGCYEVDSTTLYHRTLKSGQSSKRAREMKTLENIKSELQSEKEQQGHGYIQNSDFSFSHVIELTQDGEIEIAISATCDQFMVKEKFESNPKVQPQSHLVRSRTEQNYSVTNSNGYSIQSSQTVVNSQFPIMKVTKEGINTNKDNNNNSDGENVMQNPNPDPIKNEPINNNEGNKNIDNQKENDSKNQKDNDNKATETKSGTKINKESEDSGVILFLLIGLGIAILTFIGVALFKKFKLSFSGPTGFQEMDQKLNQNNQNRKGLHIDMGVNNTEIGQNVDEEKIQGERDSDEEEEVAHGNFQTSGNSNQSANRIKHVIE